MPNHTYTQTAYLVDNISSCTRGTRSLCQVACSHTSTCRQQGNQQLMINSKMSRNLCDR